MNQGGFPCASLPSMSSTLQMQMSQGYNQVISQYDNTFVMPLFNRANEILSTIVGKENPSQTDTKIIYDIKQMQMYNGPIESLNIRGPWIN